MNELEEEEEDEEYNISSIIQKTKKSICTGLMRTSKPCFVVLSLFPVCPRFCSFSPLLRALNFSPQFSSAVYFAPVSRKVSKDRFFFGSRREVTVATRSSIYRNILL